MSPDPKTVREIATEHILDDARRAHDIGADVLGHFGPDALTKHEYGAYCSAIREAIATATVAVSWPDEQQPADVVTAEQQQDGAVGRVEAWLDNRIHSTFYGPVAPETICSYPVDGDDCSIVYVLTESDLRAVLAERTALAARVAELESERDEDARTVDAVAAAEDDELLDRAISNLIARFADRIEALDATEAEES